MIDAAVYRSESRMKLKPLHILFPWLVTLLPIPAHADSPLEVIPAFPNLVFDDNATASAILSGPARRVIVALQRGQIRMLPEDRAEAEAPMFLDLRDKLREETEFEEGIHGLAVHPRYPENPRVYVCYSQRGPRRTVLSEFIVEPGSASKADLRSERILLEFPHPLANHWGGGITFGSDGCLYLGIGDGGLRDDPYRLGQNLWTLHGKILKLDVDRRSGGLAYGIPADNPYVDKQEIRDEIWATGLRNPWGMSFDPATETLWCGDVGQDKWEEVNLIKRGGNYGWSERDGPERLITRKEAAQEGGPFIDPIHAYTHEVGVSITGGYVYRGTRLPALEGHYLFGDWGMGKLWALSWNSDTSRKSGVRLLHQRKDDQPGLNPTVISPDADGEPLIFSHYPSMVYTLSESSALVEAQPSEEPIADPEMEPGPVIDAPDAEILEEDRSSSGLGRLDGAEYA